MHPEQEAHIQRSRPQPSDLSSLPLPQEVLSPRDCLSCKIIGSGAFVATGLYALHASRSSAPGTVIGKRLMGGIGICKFFLSHREVGFLVSFWNGALVLQVQLVLIILETWIRFFDRWCGQMEDVPINFCTLYNDKSDHISYCMECLLGVPSELWYAHLFFH